MNKRLLTLLLPLFVNNIYAQNNEINDTDKNIEKLQKLQDEILQKMSESSELRKAILEKEKQKADNAQQNFQEDPELKATKNILKQYHDPFFDLMLQWINIVEQLYRKRNYTNFIYQSQPIISAEFTIRDLKREIGLSNEEFTRIKDWLTALINSKEIPNIFESSTPYQLKNDITALHFRLLPIVSDITNIKNNSSTDEPFLAIKQGETVNIFFIIDFKNTEGKNVSWGYGNLPKSDFHTQSAKGWCNMEYLQIIQ